MDAFAGSPEGDRRHDLAHIGGHVVGDGVPETPVEPGEFPLPLVLPHALVLVEEREDADEARTGQGQPSPAVFWAKVDTVPPGMSRRRVLEPTGAREHVRGPDVIPTATVKGAREGARVGIMSVGARELRVGRPSRDKTRIPLMSVSDLVVAQEVMID